MKLKNIFKSIKSPNKAIGISMVKNEQDVIETFIRYNLQFLDQFVILDNGSNDKTPEILYSLIKEGLPIVVLNDNTFDYIQETKMTNLMRTVIKFFDPKFIIPIDADEFILCESKKTFLQELENIDSNKAIQIPWTTYVPNNTDDIGEMNTLKRILHRRIKEDPQYFKIIIPKSVYASRDIKINRGNHFLRDKNDNEVESIESQKIKLAHFPVRSKDQIRRKVLGGWLAVQATPNWPKGTCYQWENLYIQFKKDNFEGDFDLQIAGQNYAADSKVELIKDPVKNADIKLKYIELIQKETIFSFLLAFTEKFLEGQRKDNLGMANGFINDLEHYYNKLKKNLV